ncbi:MAG: hypothetical protein O2890_09770, partial [Cyanobacteria bacterium]|nr:hypothetical protein [Cyanobacteriota bacterium]
MYHFVLYGLLASGVGAAVALPYISYAQTAQTVQTGTVERVWEDGFRLNTGDRTFTVDAWDVYGDATASHVAVG